MALRLWKAFWQYPLKEFVQMFYVMRDVKPNGKCIGSDAFGNRYYESYQENWGRERWVVYKRKDFDPSQVPAEWHGWLHRSKDTPLPQSYYPEVNTGTFPTSVPRPTFGAAPLRTFFDPHADVSPLRYQPDQPLSVETNVSDLSNSSSSPNMVPQDVLYKQPHTENMTGSQDQYAPYSTTIPKIEPWIPVARSRRPVHQ